MFGAPSPNNVHDGAPFPLPTISRRNWWLPFKVCLTSLHFVPSSSSMGGSRPHHSHCRRLYVPDAAQVVIFIGLPSLHTQTHSVSCLLLVHSLPKFAGIVNLELPRRRRSINKDFVCGFIIELIFPVDTCCSNYFGNNSQDLIDRFGLNMSQLINPFVVRISTDADHVQKASRCGLRNHCKSHELNMMILHFFVYDSADIHGWR